MWYKKIITWFLISLLISQEIFRIPYSLSSAKALEIENHENIVSLLVEESLFKKIPRDIEKYALRVQSVLPRTRTVILTFSENTHPVLIASANERLYYSGLPNHGDKTQKLVGTILIGNIPLPSVYKESNRFLSIFPYIDFDEPNFRWDWDKSSYEYLSIERKNPRPELWHSVIAPHTGDITQDAKKIQDFFSRVYQYDNKQDGYSDLGEDPYVFYADSVRDSRATSTGSLAAYEKLFVPNQEHFFYNRYTKEFAKYLYENYLNLMKAWGAADVVSFLNWKATNTSQTLTAPLTLDKIDVSSLGSSSFLSNAPDISTRMFSRELIPAFAKTLSEKYIGDISRWIHQSGRYYDGYSQVRLDMMPQLIQQRDVISSQILWEANDAFEKIVNNYIEWSLSLDIPVLVSRSNNDFSYTNYFLGKKASLLQDASECSILRGSSFGNTNTVAEMNHGYHVQWVEDDVELIEQDAWDKIRCDDRVTSYWWWNTPMNLDFASWTSVIKVHKYDDFSRSIYDPAGGKRTTGQSSPFDCLKTDVLLNPYVKRVRFTEYKWPKETKWTRYSCATNFNKNTEYFNLNPSPESNENIYQTLTSCQWSWNVTLLGRDGNTKTQCTSSGTGWTYKLISSLIKHTAPDTETYGKQLTSLATPNLPVDENRYVVYVNREIKEKRFDYPNVFDIRIPIDATDDTIKQKIQQYLRAFDEKVASENTTTDLGVFSQLIPSWGTKNLVSLANLVTSSPDLEKNLIASLRWKNLPTAMKYQQGILDGLRGDKLKTVAMFWDSERKYEISYLWWQWDAKNFVLGYHPGANADYPQWYEAILENQDNYEEINEDTSLSDTQDPFTLSSSEYDELLGNTSDKSDKESSESCGDENAVVIWEWPSAIACWLKNLFNTDWEVGVSDFSFDWEPYISLTFGEHTIFSTEEDSVSVPQSDNNSNDVIDTLESDTDSSILRNIPSSYVLQPKATITLETYLQRWESIVGDNTSQVDLVLTRMADLNTGKIYTSSDSEWETIKKQSISLKGSSVLTNGKALWTIQSLTSTRMSFEFETRVQSDTMVYVRSWVFTLSPESWFPSFTLLSSPGALTPKTVRADDANGINILFQSDNAPEKVDIDIIDYVTNKNILSLRSVPVTQKTLKIGSPAADAVLHKAGKYIITLKSNGVSDSIDLFIVAGAPAQLITNIPNIVLAQEKYVTNFSLTDVWWNTISTDAWNVTLQTSQPILGGDNKKPAQDFSFPLSRKFSFQPLKESTIEFQIRATHNQESISQSLTVTALEDIQIESNIIPSGAIKVWQELPVEFVIKTKQGTVVTGWNSSVNIANKGTGAHLDNTLVTFVEGRWKATLITGTQSGKTSFYLSETLKGKKIGTDIQINPDIPSRLTFSGPEILLARRSQSQVLSVNIFDKYGNYIHPSTVDIRLQSDRDDLLEPFEKVEKIEGDVYWVRLTSLGYPWRVLIRWALWEDGQKSKKSALENVWEVQILPVITSEDVSQNTWNALTHVLLWGPFGQFVTSGYFAGSLLFSHQTQALSVSTLVDTPRPGLFSLTSTGAIEILGTPHLGTGLQTKWQPDSSWLFSLLISDKRLWGVAKVTYPRLADTDRILFVPSSADATVSDNVLSYQWNPITPIGSIFDAPNLSFTLIPSASEIRISVSYQKKILGNIILSYTPRLPAISSFAPNTYSIEMLMSDLVVDTTWWSRSSADIWWIILRESGTESSMIWGPVEDGYSGYPEQYGMGWTNTNIWLLQFAAGESWAETQKSFADYVTINLWDPLIHLPEYRVDTATWFDTSIGKPIFIGSDTIDTFSFSDINNDQQDDIIVTDTEKTLSIALSRKDGTYLDMWEFLSLDNAREGTIRTGDFFGDGYADAVYIDNGGILHLISHNAQTSLEIDLISDRNRDMWQLNQIEVFDMDGDGFDDIITLDILWQLSIFYGTSGQRFIYQFVDHVFDFAFAEKSLFSGSVYYEYPGFTFPDFTDTQDSLLRAQQEQLQSILFTQISLESTSSSTQTTNTTSSLGTQISESFSVDENAGAGDSLSSIASEFDSLTELYGNSIHIRQSSANSSSHTTLSLLKAPFIDKNILSISKKYSSLEKDGAIIQGANIQGVISIKNTSSAPLSKLIIVENFPSYLERPISTYTLKRGWSGIERKFIDDSEWWIIDLRDITLAPGETIEIIYTAKFATFSFGTFDVWFLEDKKDPLMNIEVPKDKILTIHPEAKNLNTIPEKDFYGPEKYGDIRINPNSTCGGPLFLWRSHNTFDRTYQKTLIVRNIEDPDESNMDISNDPFSADNSLSSSAAQDITTALSQDSSSEAIQNIANSYASTAQDELDAYNQDSDWDEIPDRHDEDHGDVFTIENSGNSSTITIWLWKLDAAIDSAIEGVESFMSGLSCGFGDAGCISQPMNWAINVPGNTITALGYAIPGINQAPLACYRDVRCGIPIFSIPTASYPYFWPPNPDEGGGAFDVGLASIATSAITQNTTFTGGYGTSQLRLFIGATLTGAIAEVLCLGPNNLINPIINYPGLFPITFYWNCIFATQALTQCSDDGSDDIVTELEDDEFFLEEDTSLTDGDTCGFFSPVTSYPESLTQAVNTYILSPTAANLDILRAQLSEYASLVTGSYTTDTSLLFSSSSPYSGIQSTSSNNSISYPEVGSGTGMIQIRLDSTSFDVTKTGPIFDIKLKSISAFPRFIMDWYHRQLDEIVSSFSSLPDIKIFLPDLWSWFADGGWIPEFENPNTGRATSSSSNTTSASTTSDVLTPLDVATNARDTVVSGIQGGLGWIQAAFEYLSLLPMVDVHPEVISLDLPWMDRSAMQSWIYRNEAILAQWEALPQNALGNAVNAGDLIASIRTNIETVRTYMTLPEQLRNLFYLKEKFLYEILKNVHAIQQLMGGWLYDNGERFKTWVETFILITKLWDLWQVLIDIFDDYEESCAVCHNEQWNLQEWLWIVIDAVIPDIPVIKMPRWPDIELDFSDIDLGIDIAYPVFNFSFYPLDLPDMPSPSFSGLNLPAIPQLPPLPDLHLDFELPMIQLPKLPNLPPAPLIPELSQAITVVLKIFKIVTLIQCLYRKVPLSPEWYVGTKIAHKTDRQGYLSIDFLNVNMPSVMVKWVDAIRVSTHVSLKYDLNFIIEMIESALEPLEDFPRNLSEYTGDLPSSVDINLDMEDGATVQTSSLDQLPWLIGQLYEQAIRPQNANTSHEIQALSKILASHLPDTTWSSAYESFDPDIYRDRFEKQAVHISDAIQQDIETNKVFITDLDDLSMGKKKPEDIAWLQGMNPTASHLATSSIVQSGSALIDVVTALKGVSDVPRIAENTLLPTAILPTTETGNSITTISPTTQVTTRKQESTQLKTSKGLYITKNWKSKRLHYFYENQENETVLHMFDDDRDGDKDIFYTLWNTIYRKENHSELSAKLFITDSPPVYTITTMMREFFGQSTPDITTLSHDMQIFLRDSHTAENIEAQCLIHKKTAHQQFDIFTTWWQSDSWQAQYRVDSIVPPENIVTQGYSLLSQPIVSSLAWQVSLHQNKIYRILLPGGKYIEETTSLQDLPTDFVIRAKKRAYTKENTKLELVFGNKKQDIVLRPGQVLFFAQDSNIIIKSGSLILPSDEYETRFLDRSDIYTPLFPDDIIKTGANGSASIEFSDTSETNVFPDQTWSLVYHTGIQKRIQDFTLPVLPGWYYVVARDAFSSSENRIPHATLFDAHTDTQDGPLADTLPTTINLNFDTPTEVDFQEYFPLDTIVKVEVTGLSDDFWRQAGATKILFQTSQKDQSMTLRVTSKKGIVYTYTINLVTKPATLAIEHLDNQKLLTGTISTDTTLPLTIQSFINGKSWTVSAPLNIKDKTFTTSFADISPEWSVSYENKKAFSLKRDMGALSSESGLTLVSDIRIWYPLALKTVLNQKEIARIVYQGNNLLFQQATSRDVFQKNTLWLISTSLRLEPALAWDTKLKWGAYIVDAQYRPLIAFDTSWVVRYLDPDIRLTPKYEWNSLVFMLSRGTSQLGQLVLSGDMLTVWDQ